MIPREIEELFKKLEPIYGSRIKQLKIEYQLNSQSRPEIELLLAGMVAKAFGDRTPVSLPPNQAVQGAYPLGDVVLGSRIWGSFGINEDEWIQHVAVFGRSGSGKTNTGFLILRTLVDHGKPFLVFDWKRNYRDLLGRSEFGDLKVLTVGRDIAPFHFNPLMPPPGTEPEIFLKKLIEIMMHVYWLGDGVAYLLQKAIDEVLRERGVGSPECANFPTLFDVRDWLRGYKARGREGQWMDSTRRVMETLCYGPIGRVIAAGSNSQIEEMLTSQVVLELDALPNSDKTFLIEVMLLWLHHKRMRETGREQFKHAVLIEEAHHVLLKRKESRETVVDIILREIRELGESIIFLDQHPSLISVPSLGNSYCTIAMNLKHGNDVAALSRAMLLDEEERDLLGKLPVGEALVKLQGRWVMPFYVRFPHFPVEKGKVSDADLKGQKLSYSGTKAEIPLCRAEKCEIPLIPGSDRMRQAKIESVENGFLEDVMAFPLDGINERKERLQISIRKIYSLISSLSIKGFIYSSPISTPQGRKRITRITAAGREAMGLPGNPGPERHESTDHWYWKLRLANEFRRQGYSVEVEKDGTDLSFERDGKRVAVEIETGKSDPEANIDRDLEAGFDEVIVVWTNGPAKSYKDPRIRSIALRECLASFA